MTSPPGTMPTPTPTGGIVSVAVYDGAAAAIRRAGYEPTRSRVRMVVRAQQETGVYTSELDWWDRLVREMPLGLKHPRKVTPRKWAVSS